MILQGSPAYVKLQKKRSNRHAEKRQVRSTQDFFRIARRANERGGRVHQIVRKRRVKEQQQRQAGKRQVQYVKYVYLQIISFKHDTITT
jgi:hypothetical protein